MKTSQIFISAILFSLVFSVEAASTMKPGLWEHSFTIKSQSGKAEKAMAEMKKQMANMPAEQRKMLMDMMAKQGLGTDGQNNSVKVCISKTQAENLEIPQHQSGNCTHEVISRTANSVKMKFNCKGATVTSGEGDFQLASPTSYTGKTIINTVRDGKEDRMDMDQKGKWLSADCGNVKEMPIKK